MRLGLLIHRFFRASRPGLFFLLSVSGGEARIDFDGNGVSELWERQYEGVVPDAGDQDGDGTSNHDEGIAGTDPLDPESSLKLEISLNEDGCLLCRWEGKLGKEYRIERWVDREATWEVVSLVAPSLVNESRALVLSQVEPGIFRLRVGDLDSDGDGLTAWEEALLGMDDQDPFSVGTDGEGDFVSALRLLEASEGVTTTLGFRVGPVLPDEKMAARFLLSASFGPNDQSIDRVRELGFTGWIDEQMSLVPTKMRTELFRNGLSWRASLALQGWWRIANIAPDQLRQRMAYALSQILVVNFEGGTVVGDNPVTQSFFYDIFVNGGFGPYRDVLEQVTYSPVMGFYLSHLKNRKSDDPVNPTRFPDENFAREIMQLFTIGLWELNEDGKRKLDEAGRFIPTYDNGTITEMAKVFTGMSHSTTNNGSEATSFFNVPRGNDYWYPMKVWDEEHEPGPKSIINGVELDGTQTGEEEVQATLDALVSHDSMAPFLSRLLIQRLTSSNPSPEYLKRVSRVWNETRSNPDHLGCVLKAILLDPEALNRAPTNPFHGKVREPMVRFTSLFRAFHQPDPQVTYNSSARGLRDDFGQYPMIARSVFNFYSPNFAPNEEFRIQGKVSPELELASLSQIMLLDSRFSLTIDQRRYLNVTIDFDTELLLADDPLALLDRVDLLLTGGRLKSTTRSHILMAMQSETNLLNRVKTAVYLVSQSTDCLILD